MRALVYLLIIVAVLTLGSVQGYCDSATVTAAAEPAVVFIRHRDSHGAQRTGSGFIISPGGYLVTCAHVVQPAARRGAKASTSVADKVWVRLSDGTAYEADRCYVDKPNDIAILHIPGKEFRYLRLEKSSTMQGEEVLVLGYPLGEVLGKEMAATRGILSARRANGEVLQLDAAMNPGNSGGPVLNKRGRVIGVAFARLPNFQGTNFAVSSSLISLVKAMPLDKDNVSDRMPELYLSQKSEELLDRARRLSKERSISNSPDTIDETIKCYEQVIADPTLGSILLSKCYSEMADLYECISLVAKFSKDKTKAENYARQAVECRKLAISEAEDPETANSQLCDLADTYNTLEMYAEALEAAKQSLEATRRFSEKNPLFPVGWRKYSNHLAQCEIGEAYRGLRRYAEAEESLKRAIAEYQEIDSATKKWLDLQDGDPAEAHFQLGLLYLAKGDKVRALAEHEILKQLNTLKATILKMSISP